METLCNRNLAVNIDQNKAAIGQCVKKVWGVTRCLGRGHGFEVHYLEILKGGFCSRHKHLAKWNQFFVIRGLLKVECFKPDGSDDYFYTLGPGGIFLIRPGIYHRFVAIEQTEAIEDYWTDALDQNDIARLDEGGLLP